MFRDSLGNTYGSLPSRKPNPSAKPSKGGDRKYGRNRKPSEWRQKVKSREAMHRGWGHRFPTYPC